MAPRPEKADRKKRYGSSELRADDFANSDERPSRDRAEPAGEKRWDKPKKSDKFASKDKGKPKWSKATGEADARPAKPKSDKPKDHKKRRSAE